MTTNSPNPVDGDVQALIADCQAEIEDLKHSIDRCDAIGTSDYLYHLQSKLKRQYAALASLTAEPVALRYRHINDTRWKLEKNTQIDERLTNVDQELLYTTPPAQLLRPVEKPTTKCIGWVKESIQEHDEKWISAIREAGYEVKS